MIKLSSSNWNVEGIDTILFDKDGTIIDLHTYWGGIVEARVKSVIKKLNLKEDNYESLCMAMGFDVKSKRLMENGPVGNLSRDGVIESLITALRNLGVICSYDFICDIFNEVHKQYLSEIELHTFLIPEAKVFLKKLKEKNVKMAIVTSDTHENAIAILQYLKISNYFNIVIGKDDCSSEKKTGEPARLALELLQSSHENTIVVGDAKMDYLMASNSGLKGAILVSTGQNPINSLKRYTDYTVDSLSKIDVFKY